MAVTSSGTTVVRQSMMRPIWAMPGYSANLPGFLIFDWRFRNYVTQDIIRRVMTDYFGYDVHFVMNVTDIDDKVCPVRPHIVRGNSQSS